MDVVESIRVEAGHWGQTRVSKGEHIRITCIEGSQVCDFWAFLQSDTSQFLSAEHTRSTLQKLSPEVGDALYSNRRHPMVTVTADTSPGTHDFLMSACDPRRYALLGCTEYHRSCAENLCLAMDAAGATAHELPSPFNIFQNVTVSAKGELEIIPPLVKSGQYLEMRAEEALLVVVSACPMDIAKTNGPDGKIRPVLFERLTA
ncbi:MAG: urea carboxylase-associated family protein [Pseudomonadota bacterium]